MPTDLKRYWWMVMGAALCVAQASAQARPASPSASKPSENPVTLREVYAAFDEAEAAIQKVVFASTKKPTQRSGVPDRAATRADILREMDRLFELCKPKFKFTPRKVVFDKSVLSFEAGSPERVIAEKLIALGFVGEVAPLATHKAPYLAPREFGDALGMFLLRIADLTHTPSTKFSPYINQHDPPTQ